MSAIVLDCDVCGNAIVSDPHWPHEPECSGVTDPACTCAALTCEGCCIECNPISESSPPDSDAPAVSGVPAGANPAGGQYGTATVEARQVGTQPAPPVGSTPKAINNGASEIGDGLSSPSPSSAPAERRTREASETGEPRMAPTTAVTTETARQSLATTPGHDQEGSS